MVRYGCNICNRYEDELKSDESIFGVKSYTDIELKDFAPTADAVFLKLVPKHTSIKHICSTCWAEFKRW